MALIPKKQLLEESLPRSTDVATTHETANEELRQTFTEGLEVGFKKWNTVGTTINNHHLNRDPRNIDPNFDRRPFMVGYEDHADSFMYVNSEDEALQLQQAIDDDRLLTEKQATMDFFSMANAGQMAAMLFDPINLVPGGQLIKGARLGHSLRVGTLTGARNFGLAEVAGEAVRQGTQFERTTEESLLTIAAAGLVGGVFGGGAAVLSQANKSLNVEAMKGVLRGEPLKAKVDADGVATFEVPKSAGAAAAPERVADDLELAAGGKTAIKVTQPVDFIRSPINKAFLSDSRTAKEFADNIFDRDIVLKGDYKGSATAKAELLAQTDSVRIGKVLKDVDADYLSTMGIAKDQSFKGTRQAIEKFKHNDLPFKTREDFDNAVVKSLMSGKAHSHAAVNRAVGKLQQLHNELGTRLQKAGLLDEGVDVSQQSRYFSIIYRRDLINANPKVFERDVLLNSLKKTQRDVAKMKSIVADMQDRDLLIPAEKSKLGRIQKKLDEKIDLDEGDFNIIAEQVRKTITGVGDDQLMVNNILKDAAEGTTKFQKERTLDWVDPEYLTDWIDTDINSVVGQYGRTEAHLFRFQEALERIGARNMQDVLVGIREDFEDLIQKAATAEERSALAKQRDKVIEDTQDAAKIFLGVFGKQGKMDGLMEGIRVLNTTRLLGKLVITSFVDAANPVFKFGPMRTLLDGYAPLVRNLKAAKLSRNELNDWAIANEVEMGQQVLAFNNPAHRFGKRLTKAEIFNEKASAFFGNVTLFSRWNNFHKRNTGAMASAGMLRAIKKAVETGKITKKDTLRLSQGGIGADKYEAIYKEAFAKQNATELDGSIIAGLDNWENKEARDLFIGAVRHHANSAPITPGLGDLPASFVSSQTAKTITQFKTFLVAAENRIFIPAIQRHDSDALLGITGMIGLGAQSYIIKEMIAGRDPNTDPQNLFLEGVARSGVGGLLTDAIFIGGGKVGLLRDRKFSRYGDRSLTSFMFGPSAFLAEDIANLTASAATGEFGEREMRQAQRMVPFNNIWYLETMFRAIEEGK